ncbi:hypothetical protein [Streptomyces sp. NPDC088400]|uniref:hypothetical protein n=1 Tax=Streptomyces sp. NPDC088400 TaxID=3365861 RepID=UPI00381D1C21
MNKKKAALVIAAVIMGAGLAAPSAVAAESGVRSVDCNTWSKGETGYVYCSGLGVVGAFRAKVVCTDIRGVETTVYGPWVGNGKTTSRACPGSGFLVRVGADIRD